MMYELCSFYNDMEEMNKSKMEDPWFTGGLLDEKGNDFRQD